MGAFHLIPTSGGDVHVLNGVWTLRVAALTAGAAGHRRPGRGTARRRRSCRWRSRRWSPQRGSSPALGHAGGNFHGGSNYLHSGNFHAGYSQLLPRRLLSQQFRVWLPRLLRRGPLLSLASGYRCQLRNPRLRPADPLLLRPGALSRPVVRAVERSAYPAPCRRPGPATVEILVPPDAQVWFDGDPTKQTGERRLYIAVAAPRQSVPLRGPRPLDGGRQAHRADPHRRGPSRPQHPGRFHQAAVKVNGEPAV